MRDEGSSNQQSALTTQAIDQYGNVTQSNVYPYNNATTPLRTYNNTWLNDSTHTSNYIFDRLLTSTLTTGGATKTLVQNTYDAEGWVTVNGQPFSYWPLIPYPVPTHEMDPAPIAWGSRGILVYTTTPAHTVWVQSMYGATYATAQTDGQNTTATPSSSTNYAAPQTIATQTFSQDLAYNAWLGVTQTTDINGQTLSMTYDSIGRPATSRNAWAPLNSGLPPTYTYSYSAQNVTPVTQTKTGVDGVTTTTLDGLGRAIRVSRGDSNGPQAYTDTVYSPCACSPLGKLQQASQPYAPNGSPAWTVYTYDGLGRTVTVRRPDGASTTSYAYSGNQTTVTDPGTTIDPVSGNAVPIWKTMTSDALGNLSTVSEPDPASPATATLITTYTYDWMNHVSCVDMVRGGTLTAAYSYTSNGVSCATVYSAGTGNRQTRTFVYSDAGLPTSATNPENGTVLYYYNADNTLQYKHDAKGQETVYTYDTYKRVQWVHRFPTGQSNPEDKCQQTGFFYGDQDSQGPFANYGRLWQIAYLSEDAAGNSCIPGVPATGYNEFINYWPDGQIWNKTLEITRSGQTQTIAEVTYYYTQAGSLAGISVPIALPFGQTGTSNIGFGYTFDSMNRPVSMVGPAPDGSNAAATWVQGVQYDPASRMTQLQYIAGATGSTPIYTTETMSYNTNGQMVSQSWSTPSSMGPTGGLAYSYAAGQNNGQITQVSDTISGETIVYKYDALKRLTSASSTPQTGSSTAAWTEGFQFDGFGNLTAKVLNGTSNPIAVNAPTNQLSNASYDLNGNMTSGVGATLTYDASNRTTSAAETSGGTEYYGYSPDNKRIYRLTASGTEEWTFYGGYGEKLGVFQYNASAGYYPVRSNVQFAGRTIIDDNLPVFQDRLGTNRASGARYYPYGDEISSTGNDREKFATYTRDSYTGLDYADQRFYASTYGRFNTPDPYMASAKGANNPNDPGSWNHYAYVAGDPVNRVDPTGSLFEEVCSAGDGSGDDCFDSGGGWTVSFAPPGGGGGGGGAAPQLIPCPISAVTLGNYMQSAPAYYAAGPNKGQPIPSGDRPLENWTYALMYDSVLYNVDPRLIVAIAEQETHFGADNCAGVVNTNNPFCLGDLKPIKFSTIGDAIQYVAQLLGSRIGVTTTVADLYKPVSGLYCNTAECNPKGVQAFLTKQGGGVGQPGVYGPLQSPCYEAANGAFYLKQ